MNTDLTPLTTNKDILDVANEYLQCGASLKAVCYIVGLSHSELEQLINDSGYSLAEYIDIQKAVGEAYLLREQFVLAKKNPQMSIHLGKVILGQKEPEMDSKGQFKIFGIATIAETQLAKI